MTDHDETTDLAAILDAPYEEPKPPKPLPPGTYNTIIVGKPTEGRAKTGTPFIQLRHRFLVAQADVDDTALSVALGDRALTDIVMTNNYYVTDASKWRLDQLLEDVGFEPDGTARSEYMDQLDGKAVGVFVTHQPRSNGVGIIARIDRTVAI